MSQSAPSEAETPPPHSDLSCAHRVPEAPAEDRRPPRSSRGVPETPEGPSDLTGETPTSSESPAQPEDQLTECDQSVSLEPDAAEDDKDSSRPGSDRAWGGWGSWGKSLLSSATSTVGHGLTSAKAKAGEALRLRGTSLGEEAREDATEDATEDEPEGEPEGAVESVRLTGLRESASNRGVFSAISNVVQNTGKSVISGGLDALEFIGKKTMTVLAESDPGFKRTKTLMQKTATLSQMLKEAKEKERARLSEQPVSAPTAHYGILFDDYQGLSHLEALEILSNESEGEVQAFLSSLEEDEQEEVKKELICIKEVFISRKEEKDEESGDGEPAKEADEEFVSVVTELLFELHIAATPDKLNKARMSARRWVGEVARPVATETVVRETREEKGDEEEGDDGAAQEEKREEQEAKMKEEEDGLKSAEAVYASSVGSLAEVTARSIEQLHKVAELVLHGREREKAAGERARVLARLTCAMCEEVERLARMFSDALLLVGCRRKAEELSPLVDGVLLEASNSTNYIQNAFQLLLPVLQISHIQSQRDGTCAEPHVQH
ncbi:protein NOXP20 isoform X2 [Phyllopteryx taeniolatus]|uniref:protein NOXP20 isoform X2 n=1 Tax=Phyllopteryx taeniolatus TaxID=161469 RepID=UPI002AD50917|nr:protein NOXP20 isoform X2 [Phyllopteryx taeniolatus]